MIAEREEQTLLERLLASPRLGLYARKIEQTLAREAKRRQQFYAEISEGDKVEFINGEIIYHSPVKLRHSKSSEHLFSLLKAYVLEHELGYAGHEKLMISLTRNDYEPDVCFFRQEVAQSFHDEQMNFPAPDFIGEVLSNSTAHNDRGVKFQDYAAHGVAEYWIVDPKAETVEQYRLQNEQYELVIKATNGTIRSFTVAGFEIPVRALFDNATNQAALKTILAEVQKR